MPVAVLQASAGRTRGSQTGYGMKKKVLLAVLLLLGLTVQAQEDPVVMTVGGHAVTRSEFEYSYNKNNGEGAIDRKSVAEYAEMFANYKLKVLAAEAAGLDTLQSFRDEFAGYRDQQIRPSLITDADVERKARQIYEESRRRVDANGGLLRLCHIFVHMAQKASAAQERAAKLRIDSVYRALQAGADFAELARKCSDERESAVNGGELPWIERGMTLPEFENEAFALRPGQVSRPFTSPAGWHILLLKERRNYFAYDSVKADIMRFIDQRNLREALIDQRLDSLSRVSKPHLTAAEILEGRKRQMESEDPSLRYLIKEYHDGLLLVEMSNRTVWEKAVNDEAGLQSYFARNKKKYRWEQPRFKGVACHARSKSDLKEVKRIVKRTPFGQLTEALNNHFNAGSTERVRAEKGLFKPGSNDVVDSKVFHAGTVKPIEGFAYYGAFGKKLKAPREMDDVRQLVVADYQDALEKEWVQSLRKKYTVTVNKAVLATVNNH